MEVEAINDFRALRAKFQNDSNFSSTALQPAKRAPADILHQASTDTKSVSSPRLLNKGKVGISGQKREHHCYPMLELMQSKPVALPRVKYVNLYVAGKNEDPKKEVLGGAPCGEASLREDSQKPCPTSCTYQQAAADTNFEDVPLNSFRHTLQIWESASAQNDRKGSAFPSPLNISGNCSAQPQALNATIAAEGNKVGSAGKQQILDFSTPKNSLLHSRIPVLPQTSPSPLPTRGHKSTEQSAKVTGFSQPAYDPHRPSETSQYLKASKPFLHHAGTERWLDVKDSKIPKIKPLPSIQSLGSPPKKPLRPPKVDLSAFRRSAPHDHRRNETAAMEEDYMIPENTESEELHNYEETILYLKQPENSIPSRAIQDSAGCESVTPVKIVSRTGIQEHTKTQKNLLFTTFSTDRVTQDEKEEKLKWDQDRERQQQVKKTSKISGSEAMLHKSQINEGQRNKLQVQQGDTTDAIQTGKWPAKDGEDYSAYVDVDALKGDKDVVALSQRILKATQTSDDVYDNVEGIENAVSQASDAFSLFTSDSSAYVDVDALKGDEDVVALSQRILKATQTSDDVYDNVEGIENAVSQASDAFSSFTSDSFSEDNSGEAYEDYNPVKQDVDRIERLKQLGKYFKKDKMKLKNAKMKENRRILSSSVPNLDIMSQESMVADDIDVDQKDAKEKDDKHKNWKLKFPMLKDKHRTRSSEDIEKNFFLKIKKYKIERNKKMAKEEKLFRGAFMYNKDITVINRAVALCSNASSKGKLDLPITAGEQLDVIDVTENDQIICRNSEGKYGLVLLQHLNFR